MAGNNLRLQVLLAAVDKVTGPMQKIMGGTTAATKAMRAAQGEVKKLNQAQRDLDGFRQLKQGTQDTSTALDAAKQRLHALSAEVRNSDTVTRKLSVQHRAAGRAVADLTAKHGSQQTRLNALRNTLNKSGHSTTQLGAHQRKLKADLIAANAAIDAQKSRLWKLHQAQDKANKLRASGMGYAATGAGMAFAGQRVLRGAAAPVGAAMQFESSMADVRKVVDFDTPQQFQAMSRDIQDLSMRLPMTSEGIAQIVAAAGQASVPRQELLRFAEDAAKMGVAFDSTAEEAGQTMATWRTAFRLNQDQVVELADKINYLGNTGPANVAKISEVVNRVGALGEVGGLASGQVAAIGATVAGMGIGSEVAGTGIKNLILRLTAGTAATKKQKVVFKQLGLEATEMANAMQDDAGGAILTVLRRLRELPKAQQNAAMSQLFGTESIGAIAPLLTNLELLEENLGKVGDATRYAGSMELEYASRVATSENSLQLMKNTVAVLAQTIGETLLPNFKAFAERVGVVVARVVAFARENPRLVKTLALLAIGGAAVVTVLGGLLIAGGMAAMAFGQIYNIVALLTGGQGLMALATRALPAVATGIRIVGAALVANPIGILLMLLATLAYVIYRNWSTIGPMLSAVWDAVLARIMVVWGGIKTYFSGIWDVIVGIFTGDGERLRGGLAKMWEGINTMMGGWPAKFLQFGKDMIMGLIGGITGMAGALKDSVVGAVSGAVDKFKSFLGIRSPSRVFAQFGDYTMQGFAGGLDRSQRAPLQAMATLGNRMRQVGAGVAIGAAAMPAMAMDNRPPISAAGSAAAGGGATYNITINAPTSGQAQDIAAAVRAELERIERERSARSRSRLSDYD